MMTAPAPEPFAQIAPVSPAGPIGEPGPPHDGFAQDPLNPGTPPAEPAPQAAPPSSGRPGLLRRLRLATKLPAIIVVLLALGLGVFGLGANVALSAYMTQQVDESLQGQIRRIAGMGSLGLQQGMNGRGPTDYAQGVSDDSGSDEIEWQLPFGMAASKAPAITTEQALSASPSNSDPTLRAYNAVSKDGSATWRAMSLSFSATVAGQDPTADSTVTITIALPLTSVDSTLQRMRILMIWGALPILAFGSLAGYWLVRRSLRPLKQVEGTAAAIAAGDLTQRVPEAPAGTEVGELTSSLNGMLTQIEHAFSAKEASEARMRQFVSDASHELRTPLASIRGYGELYRMGALARKKDRDEAMRRVEQEATRMGSLVQDLLQLARLDEGRQLRREPVDLTHVALDAAADAHAADPARPIAVLGLDGAPLSGADPVIVTGDEDRIRQIVTNLLTNASKHTPPGTGVEIQVGREQGGAALAVRDHGEGIDADQAAKIFERFYRLDSSRTRESGGSGLGLAIVASLVEAHGGKVWVEPTPGGGATFKVWLPS